MEMEDLTKRLRASGEVEKCCLAAVIENECRRLKTEPLEGISKTVNYLYGCLEAICAFGEITEAEAMANKEKTVSEDREDAPGVLQEA